MPIQALAKVAYLHVDNPHARTSNIVDQVFCRQLNVALAAINLIRAA